MRLLARLSLPSPHRRFIFPEPRIHRATGTLAPRRVCLLMAAVLGLACAPPALAGPKDDVQGLMPLWRGAAPLCDGAPSAQSCEDGDMTLFSGLLCAAGESAGCAAVKDAQGPDGRWHRSPRLRRHPELRPKDSFSWDMALGVQIYAARTGDHASLSRWLSWVEANRPCLTETPDILGKSYCLVRGWPRWCTDDHEEHGCTARPQDLATLAVTLEQLHIAVPPPAEDPLPGGLAGIILKPLQDAARDANAQLSLQRLLPPARELQPTIILLDAMGNRPGYSRHLVGVEVMLFRAVGLEPAEVSASARILATSEPENPFFLYLAEGPTDAVAVQTLRLAPPDSASLPQTRADWAWQRTDQEKAWLRSSLWDFVFMGRLLAN